MNKIDVQIETPDWRRDVIGVRDLVRRAARLAAGSGDDCGLTVLLTSDTVVRDLNTRFRDKDAATNVLAFPAVEGCGCLGDIALAHDVCALEAAEQGKSLADHLRHLVIHGVLHLRGYDHLTEAKATEMEGLERRLLARLGVDDPYIAELVHG